MEAPDCSGADDHRFGGLPQQKIERIEFRVLSIFVYDARVTTLSPRPTTGAMIAAEIRTQILRGERVTDEPLRQDELAGDFGVSKIPIREALVQLESEGLVTVSANRGASIKAKSPEELEEIFLMRVALEPIALRVALPRFTNAGLNVAEGLLEDFAATDDPANWSELNWAFHSTLYQPAGLPRLLRTIESLHARTATYVAAFRGWDMPESADAEHRAILRFCRDRDTARATEALVSHLDASRVALHRLFSDN